MARVRGADLNKNVALVGFMGAGKTTAAQAVGLPVVDADDLVEQAAGKSIAAVFQDDGEAAFRSDALAPFRAGGLLPGDRAVLVDRLSQGVDDAPDQRLADRHAE